MSKRNKSQGASAQKEEEVKIVKAIPRNEEQRFALQTIDKNIVTFLEGQTGGGKTHCAIAYGLQMLLRGQYERIILTKPIVEACGEEAIGLLPGTLADKVEVYTESLFDIFYKYLSPATINNFIIEKKIVVKPLSYLRGCTFSDAYCILDEAQNATIKQLHLFLTRIGEGTKVVITGDACQSDIRNSGFSDIINVLEGVAGIATVTFTELSSSRHPVVIEIDKRIKEFKARNS